MDRPHRDPRPAEPVGPTDRAGPTLIRDVDLCRGLFAFLVVAAHAYDVCWVIHPEAMHALPPLVRTALFATVQSGFYWVMGFFVLSGYCIQLSANRLLDAGRFPLGQYLMARLTRIMPLYYLGLLFALLVEWLVAPIRPTYYPDGVDGVGFGSQLVFVQRLARTFGAFAPSWTITNELFYYVCFGLLAVGAARSRSRPAWFGLAGSLAIGGVLVGLHLLGIRHGLILGFGLLFALGANWFLGALLAIYGPRLARVRVIRGVARAWPVAFVVAIALRASDRVPELAIDLWLGGTFAGLLLSLIARDKDVQARAEPASSDRGLTRLAGFVGLASYPTYLFHGPILLALAALIRRGGIVADWRMTWLILVAAGVGAGSLLGWGLERPIMRWRAGYLARLKAAAARPTARPAVDRPPFGPASLSSQGA